MSHAKLRVRTLVLAAVALMASAPALADEAAPEAAAEPEGPLSRLSGSFQADFTNVYFFRGILQERDGFIAQPWGELYYSLYKSEDGFIRDFSIGGGVWASFHTEETRADHGPTSLYETDWYPVISLEFPHSVSLTTIYYFYTSPNDAFDTVEELNFKLAWDDSETLRSLRGAALDQPGDRDPPHVLRRQGGRRPPDGHRADPLRDRRRELPGDRHGAARDRLRDRRLLRARGRHENPFGYLSFGLSASVPLAFMPESDRQLDLHAHRQGLSTSRTPSRKRTAATVWIPRIMASIGVEFYGRRRAPSAARATPRRGVERA